MFRMGDAIQADAQTPKRSFPWIDARTGIDMSRWWNDPEIFSLIERRVAELNEFAERIEDAQRRLRAHLVAQGRITEEASEAIASGREATPAVRSVRPERAPT